MKNMISEVYIGKKIEDLPTPCLVLDMKALSENIKLMQDYVNTTKCDLRPHIKAHKCPQIAHMQLEAGAVGITCAKLGEAEVMVHAGIKNILIANQVIGESKVRALAALNRYACVMPSVDDVENIKMLSKFAVIFGVEIPLFIEVNTALNRCGVRSAEEAAELAKAIAALPNVHIGGIQAYEGRPKGCETEEARRGFSENAVGIAENVRKHLIKLGYDVPSLSCASTGTSRFSALAEGSTEIQPGSYALMETEYDASKIGMPFKQALFVLAQVISVHGGKIMLSAGDKAVAIDQGMPKLALDPEAEIAMHEEHALVNMTDKLKHLKVGDIVTILPSHCCGTVNMHDYYFCARDGIVDAVWQIAARGRAD